MIIITQNCFRTQNEENEIDKLSKKIFKFSKNNYKSLIKFLYLIMVIILFLKMY